MGMEKPKKRLNVAHFFDPEFGLRGALPFQQSAACDGCAHDGTQNRIEHDAGLVGKKNQTERCFHVSGKEAPAGVGQVRSPILIEGKPQ